MECQIDLVVAVGGGVRGRGVAETVLGAQLFGDLVVDLGDILVLLHLEETASGLLGHALEDLFAVDVALAAAGIVAAIVAATTAGITAATRIASAAAGIASAWVTAAGIASAATAAVLLRGVLVTLFAFEVDGVDDGVGALAGFDGSDEVLFAVPVDSIGEDDEGFAAALLAHELVGGEKEGVVECGAAVRGGFRRSCRLRNRGLGCRSL